MRGGRLRPGGCHVDTVQGARINHLVLNVRDIEASHRFYTEVLGFEQCGDLTHTMTMRFYRGDASRHHDLALAQVADPATLPNPTVDDEAREAGVNHIAIGYPIASRGSISSAT